jgi:CelD/BcsL family acetyltransferase involved in cellulose biosynthesis
MSMPQLVQLSLDQITEHARAWDELWQRSPSRLPCQQAAGIRLWCDRFAPETELIALTVQQGSQWLAALPLLCRRKGPFRWYQLPNDCTVASGDLLVDPTHRQAAIECLADGLASMPRSIVALEGIEIETPRWQQLIAALQSRGVTMHQSRGHDVGVVDVLHDWDAYEQSWSRNHRSALKRSLKKLNSEGNVVVRRVRTAPDDELETMLETCFAIENRSWKGTDGTSILQSPGLRDYYHREAKLMRQWGMLDLWLLEVNGETIAFEYCHFAKGVCLSHKISFDPQWDRFSPGRLLRYFQLQQYHDDPSCRELDTLGVLCEAKAKWITRRYRSARLYVGVGGGWPSLGIAGWKTLREIRNRRQRPVEPEIKAGAERYPELASKRSRVAPLAPITTLPCAVVSMPVRSTD